MLYTRSVIQYAADSGARGRRSLRRDRTDLRGHRREDHLRPGQPVPGLHRVVCDRQETLTTAVIAARLCPSSPCWDPPGTSRCGPPASPNRSRDAPQAPPVVDRGRTRHGRHRSGAGVGVRFDPVRHAPAQLPHPDGIPVHGGRRRPGSGTSLCHCLRCGDRAGPGRGRGPPDPGRAEPGSRYGRPHDRLPDLLGAGRGG